LANAPLKKHIEESPKIRALREKRRTRRKRIAIFFCVLVLALFGGFVYAARLPRFQIRAVNVSGNQVIDTEDIVTEVDRVLAGNYMYVIPRRNAFFYPKQKIAAILSATFPRFKSVLVSRTDLNMLAVAVTELRGHALWCVEGDASCYFTDDAGKVVSLAPQYSGNVYPRFYGGSIDPNDANPLGKTFIDGTIFQKLLDFGEKLTDLGFHVKGLVIGTDEENTFLLDLGGGTTASVRFLKADDYKLLAANLASALPKIEGDFSKLEYFDLRFDNKVYYKFSGDASLLDQTQ
jgi:hypothetical protein